MFLKDLSLAVQKHEGWIEPCPAHPLGSVSFRNLNPGNMRLSAYMKVHYGAKTGYNGFALFKTYIDGLNALMDDLRAKITGHSAHIDYTKKPTFLTMIKVYAPSDDGNDSNGYCHSLCVSLASYHISPSTPLSDLAKLV